jgi:phosphatidylinositol alpha-1,6-mannosyltransferase
VYVRKAAGGNFPSCAACFGTRGSKPDWVICGHLNLLRAAWLLARLPGARLALIIHGNEAWKRRSCLYGLMLKSVDSFIAMSPT